MSKKAVRKVVVGVVLAHYIDERYIRDRDEVVRLFEGETDADAVKIWLEEYKHWIRPEEKKYVKVIREVPLDEYVGHEIMRWE